MYSVLGIIMSNIFNFDSGITLVHEKLDGLRSVAIGIYFAVGSCNENKTNNGLSHFIEHMMFKGTTTRTALQISEEIDDIGGQINAFTSKQMTAYYTVSLADKVYKCFEILSDILLNSTFDEKELERERGVILEEISMNEDDYADICFENLNKLYFGKNSLALPILGSRNNVKKFSVDDIKKYISQYYIAENLKITVVGNIEFEQAKEYVKNLFEGKFKSGKKSKFDIPHTPQRNSKSVFKKIEQANMSFGFQGVGFSDSDTLLVSLLTTAIGGGMSSRLFQSIREKEGLAYIVNCSPAGYLNNGCIDIYIATNPKMVEKTCECLKKELDLLKTEGLTLKEFNRSKQQLKSSLVLGRESTSAIMRLHGRYSMFDQVFDLDKKMDEIDKITLEDANLAIKKYFDYSKMIASYVGKKIESDLLDIFTE